MLLFLTREARWSLSIDDRLVGDGDNSLFPNTPFSEMNRLGVAGSRPCQNNRGDEFPSDALKGEDWNGDESIFIAIFCSITVSMWKCAGMCLFGFLTFGEPWLKLGEFCLLSVGANSVRARGIELPILAGDVFGVLF